MYFRPVRTSQVQGPARIDWNNPITRGLAGAVGVNSGTSIPVLTGAPEYAATPSGMAYRWIDGANASARVPTATFTGSAYTLLTVFTPRALGGGFKKIAGWQVGSGGAFFNWDHGNPAYSRAIELWAGGVTGVLKYPDVTLGRRTVWAAVASGTSLVGYADGKLAGSATLTGTPSGWTTLTNGQTATDPTGAVDGMLTLAFNRALGDAEIKSLSDNPWQIFAPDSKSLWTPAAVSVTLPTLVRPTSTISAGLWVPTGAATLHETIDEEFHVDADYMSVNAASTVELELAEAAFPGGPNQTLAYWASSTQGSTLTVTLKQGATQIMTRTHALTGTDTLYTQTLTAPEIALITAGPISVTLTTS